MNLTHLQFAQSVAELASFSRAAEKCHVTQSSLSTAISQLEDRLGGRIFSRTTRKVGITSFGNHILPLIASVLSAAGELSKGAQECLNPAYKIIRVGLTPLIDSRIVAAAVEPFKRRHSDVDIIFKECYLNDLQQRLLEGTLDLAFRPCGAADKRIGRHAFYDEELFYLPGNPSPNDQHGLGPVQLEQIASETFALSAGCGLADSIRRSFRQHRLKMREYPGQALSYKVLEDWAGLGVASAIVPKSKVSTTNRSARVLQNSSGAMRIRYEMAWNRKAFQPGYLKDFLAHFHATAKRIASGLSQINTTS